MTAQPAGARTPIHWPKLIAGPLDGWPTILSNETTVRVPIPNLDFTNLDDLDPTPELKTAEYSLRLIADDGTTKLVARVHVDTTTDQARLQLLLTHPDAAIQ